MGGKEPPSRQLVDFAYEIKVDRMWHNRNHIAAVQGPVVVIEAVRRRLVNDRYRGSLRVR
jgi:hypothetical protein